MVQPCTAPSPSLESGMAGLSLQTQPKKPTVQRFMNSCCFPEEVARIVDQYITPHRITLLYSTADAIRYEIAAGIPHPDEPCTHKTEEVEDRTYVRQEGASYLESCLNNAFQMIRFPIGSKPSPDLQEKRRMELVCSESHKQFVEWHAAFPRLDQMLDDPSSVDRTQESQREQNSQNDAKGIAVPLFLRQFVAAEQTRFSHLIDFINWYKNEKITALQTQFIERQQWTVPFALSCITSPGLASYYYTGRFHDRPCYRYMLQKAITVIQASQLYQLEPSGWQKEQKFEQLVTELKEKGPLVMNGSFGPAAYQKEKIKLTAESTSDQEVFGWPAGARSAVWNDYIITVVGAQKGENKNYVYYVDPSEESDPRSGMKRALYKISYESLAHYARQFSNDVTAYGRPTRHIKT